MKIIINLNTLEELVRRGCLLCVEDVAGMRLNPGVLHILFASRAGGRGGCVRPAGGCGSADT